MLDSTRIPVLAPSSGALSQGRDLYSHRHPNPGMAIFLSGGADGKNWKSVLIAHIRFEVRFLGE